MRERALPPQSTVSPPTSEEPLAPQSAVSPRLKVAYLLLAAIAAFLSSDPKVLAGLCLLQAGLWLLCGLPASAMSGLLRRLWSFALILILTCALFPEDLAAPDALWSFSLLGWRMGLSSSGLLTGAAMTLRILAVMLASSLVRLTGEPGDLVEGLRGWMFPELAALTIDRTLALLDSQGRSPKAGAGEGSGMGGGGGRGGGRRAEEAAGESLTGLSSLRRLKERDFGPFVEMVASALRNSKAASKEDGSGGPRTAQDVSVISGLCALMLTTKLLKVLPGLPFAPGWKILFLMPLYILAALLTRTPFGATITGTTVGFVSFLFGDGRFGVFEILKHITPGLVVDLAVPMVRPGESTPTPAWACVALGTLAALARTTTMLAVVYFVSGNAVLYALVAAQALSQVFFGALSGLVTAYLLRSLARFKEATQ